MTTIQEHTVMETQETSPNLVPIKSVSNSDTDIKTDNDNDNKELEFTRINIESLGNNIRLVDSDEDTGLALFCYVRCGPSDEGLILQCRGVVFHNNDIVMKAFPYTIEYSVSDVEKINNVISPDFEKCSFYDAHEGALIRMFNFGGKWFTSTHRKLDAFRSKWASRESFGSAFLKALESEAEHNSEFKNSLPGGDEDLMEKFQSTLDVNKQYMFLVRNSHDNRIVCSAPDQPTLFHVGTFIDGELVMTEDINIPQPKKHSFLTMEEMCEYVEQINPSLLQGVIVFAPDNKQYKIFHKEYLELFRARGNEPSIKFRYLQVRMNRKQTNMLYYLYPETVTAFDDYENALYNIARDIYRAYVNRFIKKNYVKVPVQEFVVIRECHSWHLEDRVENRISQNKVIEVLNKQSPTNLNQMIRRYNSEQNRKIETQEVNQNRIRSNTITSSPKVVNLTPPLPPLSSLSSLPSPVVSDEDNTTNK